MFFIASNVLWIVPAPVTLLMAGAFIGALFVKRFPRAGRGLMLLCAGALILIAAAPIGASMLRPLEERFPSPPTDLPPPYGIIILGGAIDNEMSIARNQVTFLEGGASRLTESVVLARRYPYARIVYTGGSCSLPTNCSTEATDARTLLAALGVDSERIELESRSRNMAENASFTAALVKPQPDQNWLLVTSAYHMPRAMGLFERVGFKVQAYPVDYQSAGRAGDWRLGNVPVRNLRLFNMAVHEWIGLIVYRAAGKIDNLFPAP
jgi:uncharacterized SAM-binding protein YcdF (DUF218 family)